MTGSGDGTFWRPEGVAVASDGSIYVADTQNNRIQKFSSNGDFLTKWGTLGSGDGQFDSPKSIAVGPDDMVYIVDTYNQRIQKFDSTGNFVMKWGSPGTGDGEFYSPYGIAVGPDGTVYVSDVGNACIQKFDSTGNFISKWTDIQPGWQFNTPTGIAVGPDGSVYVADTWNFYIHKFDSNGNFITNWQIYGRCGGECDPLFGVVVGPDGSVYVTNLRENAISTNDYPIQKFDGNGNLLARWGSYGSGDGQFNYPEGIAIASDGSVYVADMGNHRIQRMSWTTIEDVAETLFETTLPINQPASAPQDYTTDIGTLNVTGKLLLQAILKNSLDQTVAQASYSFYIFEGGTVLSFNTDKKVYKPAEPVTITGQVENRATIEAANLILSLHSKLSTQNSELVFTDTFNIPAGGTHPFTVTAVAGAKGTVTLTGIVTQDNSTLVEIADQYEVAKPNVSVSVSVPDIAGNATFILNVEMKNTTKVEATVQFGVMSSEFGDSQTITIPPGEMRILQYSQQITKDTTYTFTFTGDLEQTIQKQVHFGEKAEIQLTLQPLFKEGDVVISYQLKNTGELEAAYPITFTLFNNGQEISKTTKTFMLPVGGIVSDSISYNLSEGAYILGYETVGYQGESQINIVKAAQGEITMGVNGYYPEGTIILPYTVKNTGPFDEEFQFEFELGTSLISKTAFISAGGSYSSDVRYDLTSGDYAIRATLTSQPSNSFSKGFRVVKENQAEMAVSLGAQADGLIPVNINLTNIGFNTIEGSVQLSVIDIAGATVWNGYQDVSLPSSSTPSPSTQIFNINSSAFPAGNYTLKAELLNNSSQVIAVQSSVFGVQSATFQIIQLPPYQTFQAGQEATFTFRVKNTGNQEGPFELRFKAYDLIDSTQREWLKGGEEKEAVFSFMLPEDLEEKDYFADYELKGSVVAGVSKGQIKYHLAGINLNVSATLDKPYYNEGETAHLTINIQSPNPNPQNLFARVNYTGFEPQQTFTLNGSQVLVFDVYDEIC